MEDIPCGGCAESPAIVISIGVAWVTRSSAWTWAVHTDSVIDVPAHVIGGDIRALISIGR